MKGSTSRSHRIIWRKKRTCRISVFYCSWLPRRITQPWSTCFISFKRGKDGDKLSLMTYHEEVKELRSPLPARCFFLGGGGFESLEYWPVLRAWQEGVFPPSALLLPRAQVVGVLSLPARLRIEYWCSKAEGKSVLPWRHSSVNLIKGKHSFPSETNLNFRWYRRGGQSTRARALSTRSPRECTVLARKWSSLKWKSLWWQGQLEI